MLEHLIEHEGEPVVRETAATERVSVFPTSKAVLPPTPTDLLQAQANTADWMAQLDDDAVLGDIDRENARKAFGALTTSSSLPDQTQALLALHVPEQVRHVVGMLTAYDWEFVEQAKQIRGYVVAKLLQEAEGSPKAGDRIKALTALGKVTEVGLFTEKVEVKEAGQTDEELDARIKDRLAKLRGVVDALTPQPDTDDVDPKPDQPQS